LLYHSCLAAIAITTTNEVSESNSPNIAALVTGAIYLKRALKIEKHLNDQQKSRFYRKNEKKIACIQFQIFALAYHLDVI